MIYLRRLRRRLRAIPRPRIPEHAPLIVKKAVVLTWYPSSIYRRPLDLARYFLFDRETTNFTYEISNRDDLAQFVAELFGLEAAQYIDELEADTEFRTSLNARLRARPDRNKSAHYGRRAGWYAAIRALKPDLVIESGVHDGLGSAILLRALERNGGEGRSGRLIGIDIDSKAGWLIPPGLKSRFEFVCDSSLAALPRLLAHQQVDVFIHDSDHRYRHQWAEYGAVLDMLSHRGILLCDDASPGGALETFARENGRPYTVWKEQTRKHFYEGTALGISVSPLKRSNSAQGDRVAVGRKAPPEG